MSTSVTAVAGTTLAAGGCVMIALYTWLNGRARRRGARAHFVTGWLIGAPGMLAMIGGWALLALSPPHLRLAPLSVLGVLLLLAGVAVYAAGARAVGRWKTLATYESGLHVSGIYERIRHPQALSLILVAVGGACASTSLAFVATLPLWVAFWVAYTHLEERNDLLPAFGDDYRAYMKRTPRLLPRFLSASR